LSAAVDYQNRQTTRENFTSNVVSPFLRNEAYYQTLQQRINFSKTYITTHPNNNNNEENDDDDDDRNQNIIILPGKGGDEKQKYRLIFEQLCRMIEISFQLLELQDRHEQSTNNVLEDLIYHGFSHQIDHLDFLMSYPEMRKRVQTLTFNHQQFRYLIEHFIGDDDELIDDYLQKIDNQPLQQHRQHLKVKFWNELFKYWERTKQFEKLLQPQTSYFMKNGLYDESYRVTLMEFLDQQLPDYAWITSIHFQQYAELTKVLCSAGNFNYSDKKKINVLLSLSKLGSIVSDDAELFKQSEFLMFVNSIFQQFSLPFMPYSAPFEYFNYFLRLSQENANILYQRTSDLIDSSYQILSRLLEVNFRFFK
jgi:hypothetical protein